MFVQYSTSVCLLVCEIYLLAVKSINEYFKFSYLAVNIKSHLIIPIIPLREQFQICIKYLRSSDQCANSQLNLKKHFQNSETNLLKFAKIS